MKTKLLLSIFLCGSIAVQGQNNKITGFGAVRLGEDISMLNKIGYKKGRNITSREDKVKSIDVPPRLGGKITKYFEFIPDTTLRELNEDFSSLDKRVRCFYVPEIVVSDGISLKSVYLRFYEDKLFEVKSDYPNLAFVQALGIKYKLKGMTKTTLNGYEISKNIVETGDSLIVCYVESMDTFQRDGNMRNSSTLFMLLDKTHEKEILAATKERYKILQEREKNKLKNF